MSITTALWTYRGFIIGSVQREFQSKYRNSLLGAAWTVLNPLAMIVVYTVIFAQVMRAKLPGVDTTFAYSIYLCAGVLTWGLFAEITTRAQNMFLEHANLLKKLSFPRLCLPVTVVANATLNFAIVFGLFTAFLVLSGNFPGWPYLGLFPVLAIQIIFAIGLGISLGVLPKGLQPFISLNPMASLVAAYQTILVSGQWPNWYSLVPAIVLSFVLCAIGLTLFRKHAGEMVDEL